MNFKQLDLTQNNEISYRQIFYICNCQFLHIIISTFSYSMLEDLKLLINTMNNMSDEQRNIEINKTSDACEQIAIIQSANPKIFLKSVYALLNILEKSLATSDPGETVLLYDTIKANISECSHLYKKKKNQGAIIKFVQLVCYQISKIFNNPRQQFLNIDKNQEGVDLEQLQKSDPHSALALTYVDLLNQVIDEVSFTDLIPQFILQLYPLAQCGNEKIQAAFFICIGEFSKIQNIEQQSNLIQIIYNGINNKNPKVRYYSIYALSCFSKELDQQKFHQKYYHEFFSLIIFGLNQTSEQLACQWLQCFNSYIGKIGKKKQLLENVEHIMEKVCLFIQHSKGNKIKEYSLDCLVQLANIPQLFNIQKIQKSIQIFYAIIKSLPIETHKPVINKALKSLCKIIVGLKYERGVQKYIDFALNTIQNFNSKIQVETLLSSWRLLCFSGVKFNNWTMFFQFIFQIAKGYCENNQYPQRSSAYLTFKYTSICFEQKFGDYFIPTLQIIMPCLRSAIQKNLIGQVAQICQTIDIIISNQRPKSNISENYKENSQIMKQKTKRTNEILPSEFLNLISEIFQFYLEFLLKANEVQNKIKESILFSFKLLIEHYGDIFPEISFESLINNYWNIVQIFFSDKNYNNFTENQIFQSSGQEQQQSNDDQSTTSDPKLNLIDDEDDQANNFNRCRIVLPLILGSIIQHMTEPKRVLNRILLEIQRQMNSYKDHYDLICVTRYIISIQQIPYQQISEHNPKIISFFKQYCTNLYPSLRTQISYAVCKMIINTPLSQDFKIKLDVWLEIVNKCYSVPKNQFDDEEDFGTCRDNCVSVLGHIIHKFGNHFNLAHLHDLWLDNLPLKHDKEQYKTQIDFLSNLIVFQPHTLISPSEVYQESQGVNVINKVSKILRIFSDVKSHIEREPNIRENRDTLRRAKSAVKNIFQWPIFKQNSRQIQSQLSEEQSAHLLELLQREY